MPVREFDANDDRIVLGSTGLAIASGGYSIVMVANPATDDLGFFFTLRASGAIAGSAAQGGLGRLAYFTGSDDDRGSVGITTGEWQILRLTKPAGTSQIRFSRKALSGGGWTHISSTGTADDIAGVVDEMVIAASAPNGANVWGGRLAVVALLPELSDSDTEAIGVELSSQFLLDLGAYGLWNLDQADTGTAVLDLAATANQTAITGTTVIADDDPPGWDFDVIVIAPLDFSVRLSGGASNDDPTTSLGGVESSTEAGADLFDDVTNAERVAGLTDYRWVYVHNDDAVDGAVVAYVPQQLEAGRELAIGVASEAAGETVAELANDHTAPDGVAFSAPASAATGLSLGVIPPGNGRGLCLRRLVSSGTPIDPTNFAKVRLEISRTE